MRGKYAVGQFRFCVVDAADFGWLSQYSWKAKPNAAGTHVYAVRTQKLADRTIDVRLHREVIGYSGPLDVDHIDRNTMNNTRANLRVVSRSTNVLNTDYDRHAPRPWMQKVGPPKPNKVQARRSIACGHCGEQLMPRAAHQIYCSELCRHRANSGWSEPRLMCGQCGVAFWAQRHDATYCSDRCKRRAEYLRWKARAAA